MKTLTPMATVFALVLSLIFVTIAIAQKPTNIRMSDAPDGEAVIHFPPGTEVVYFIFDYTDMEGQDIKVRVYDNVGNVIFEQTRAYQGAGTESIAIQLEKGAFPDSRYVTNLYLGGYTDVKPEEGFALAKTIIWEMGEPPTLQPPAQATPSKVGGRRLPTIPILLMALLLLIWFVVWVLRRALAAG